MLRGEATIGAHNDALTAWSNLSLNPEGGNVGIGTADTKGYKLAVAGSAVAESVTVKLKGAWPDYVFDKVHKSMSLPELKSYIEGNHHLPDMPIAIAVALNGLNLGEINRVLVKTVEELTLHVIEKMNN